MFGVLTLWNELSVTWYETLASAQLNAVQGDIIIVQLVEVK